MGENRVPPPLTISIALCTFNGEKYLQEQLDSFLRQTRLPDELVVCDDGSRDGTVALLEAFAAQAPFPVRRFINPENLGISKNFEKALSLCTGDLIALSDQDDVWLPQKLFAFEKVFVEQPQVGAVVCNAAVVDENLQPLGYSMWEVIGFTPQMQKQFAQGSAAPLIIQGVGFCGATMAIHSQVKTVILPIPPFCPHDSWVSVMVSIVNKIALLPAELNQYRQHQKQYCGLEIGNLAKKISLSKSVSKKDYYELRARMFAEALARLTAYPQSTIDQSILTLIKDKIIHLRVRAKMPDSRIRRFPVVLREAMTGRYHRFSNGWISILKDLWFPI
jgi:glycosyltransferase involved in cell wall biosynthesis